MNWVLSHLKNILRRETMIGTKQAPLIGDPRYKISAEFSSDRIPQLKKAIEILEQHKDEKPKTSTRIKTKLNNQLNLWQQD